MSLSKRVNVFLERARNLNSASPKLTQKSRSPVKHLESSSPTQHLPMSSKQYQENSLITDLEQMIDSFLRSRTETLKRVENTSQKEQKFIQEVKKTIESEKLKTRNSGISELEKEYKEKAEKLLSIVKQEASRIDRKLVELQGENLRLKQELTEKNLEVVDRRLSREVYSVDQVLNCLCKDLEETQHNEVICQLAAMKGTVYDGSLDLEIHSLLKYSQTLSAGLAKEIISKASSWKVHLQNLEEEIEKRRLKYQALDQQIRNFPHKVYQDEIEFGSREARSATFGNTSEAACSSVSSEVPSINEILSKVFSEVVSEIEALEALEASTL